MTDTYALTAHDELMLAQHEMRGATAWAVGFCAANALVDAGTALTRKQVLASIPGINFDADGVINSFVADRIADRHGFPWANSQDFVNGVKASIDANSVLLGVQHV